MHWLSLSLSLSSSPVVSLSACPLHISDQSTFTFPIVHCASYTQPSAAGMAELIRDTAVGHILRFVTRNKVLQYQEEKDPSLWRQYIDERKSGYLAHHGDPTPPEDDQSIHGLGGVRTREGVDVPQQQARRTSSESSRTLKEDGEERQYNQASGVPIDPEKGKDQYLVSWWGDNDPGKTAFCTTRYVTFS